MINPATTTAGYTAMPLDEMDESCTGSIKPKHSLLVQLPEKTYATVNERWGLPPGTNESQKMSRNHLSVATQGRQ